MADTFAENVQLARRGDAAAFARLYADIYEDLYHVARFSLRNPQDAADAVSEAVLDAFDSIGRLRNPAAFRCWIFRILAAKIKRMQQTYYTGDVELQEDTDGILSDYSYCSHELRAAIRTLAPENRLLLSLSILGGYSSRELAKMLGGTANTTRSRLMRIKQQLREELTERSA